MAFLAVIFDCVTIFLIIFQRGHTSAYTIPLCISVLMNTYVSLQYDASLKSLQQGQEYHAKFPKWYPFWFGPFHAIIRTSDLENIKLLSQLPGGILVCDIWARV